MPGYGFGARQGARLHLGSPTPTPTAPFTSIAADGWQASYAATPSIATPVGFPVSRQGYDGNGNATTLSETLYVTHRVRQPYPAQASLTALNVAISDYLLATDTVTGATNASTEVSPPPVANWVTPDRTLIGNSIGGSANPVELVAFHYHMRGGKQVAAVRYLITDGTGSIAVIVSTPTVSGRTGDRNAVITYALPATDISALNAGLITVNAEVYPHIGTSATVLKSADVARSREFSPRYFRKDVTRAAAPPLAYVGASGNNATAVVSTSAATAKASPFLTVTAALDAIQSAYGASGSRIDGCRIRILGGGDIAWGGGAATAKSQKIAELVIERDPDALFADVRLTLAGVRMRLGSGGTLLSPIDTGRVRIRDVRVQRTNTTAIQGESATKLEIAWDNVELDLGNQNAAYLSNAHDYGYGVDLLNPAASAIAQSANGQHRCWRGLNLADTTAVRTFEGYLVVGSLVRRTGDLGSVPGQINAFTQFLGVEHINPPFSATGSNMACIQNLFEFVSATSAKTTGITPDSAPAGATNILFCNNSMAGFNDHGRSNHVYDEGATARSSKFVRQHGNIVVQMNCKGDVFVTDGARRGNWAFANGVGCTDNFSMFRSANGDLVGQGASFAQDYAGLGADFGTSNTVRHDPLFTAPAATGSGPTAGTGGGTYTLQPGSPCKASATAVLSHDLAGNARPSGAAQDSKGAFL